jgi:ABC-type polysaccharide/polyol phosphate export permease
VWFVVLATFIASCATTLAVLNVHLRDVNYFVSIALQLQFYMTPIIYPLNQVPGSKFHIPFRTLVRFQPMSVFVEVFRACVYELGTGAWKAWVAMLVWTLIAVVLARFVYERRGLDLSEEM